MTEYFAAPPALSKSEFLACYNDTVHTTKLLIAPFGMPLGIDALSQLFGGVHEAKEHVSNIYRTWEDHVSRKTFRSKGICDETVASSIYLFTQKMRDIEVIQAIEGAQVSIENMIYRKTSNILECTAISKLYSIGYNEEKVPSLIVSMMRKVIKALSATIGKSKIARSFGDMIDCGVHTAYDITVPLKPASAGELYFLSTDDNEFMAPSSLDQVMSALKVVVSSSNDDIANANAIESLEINFSVEEYHHLIDMNVNTLEMTQLFQEYGLPPGTEGLNLLRAGKYKTKLQGSSCPIPFIYVNTVFSFISQYEVYESCPPRSSHSLYSSDVMLRMLSALYRNTDQIQEEEAVLERLSSLRQIISGHHDYFIVDNVDNDCNELGGGHQAVLPAYCVAMLRAHVAECLMILGMIDEALEECDQAIEQCKTLSKAHELRAKILMSACDGKKESVGDAFYAFALGGGVDLQLADLAEDAAKEVISKKARSVFKKRCRQKLESIDRTCGDHIPLMSPSGWFLEAYLDTYDPIDIALGIDMNLCDIFESQGNIQCDHCHETFSWCYPEGLSDDDTDVLLRNNFLRDALIDVDANDINYNFKAYYALCILADVLMAAHDPLSSSSRNLQMRDSVVVNVVDAGSSNDMIENIHSCIERSLQVPHAPEIDYRTFNAQVFGISRSNPTDIIAPSAKVAQHLSILLSKKSGNCETHTNSDHSNMSSEKTDSILDKFQKKWFFILSIVRDKDVRDMSGVVFDEYGRIIGFDDDIYSAILQQEGNESNHTTLTKWSYGDQRKCAESLYPTSKGGESNNHSKVCPKIRARILNVMSTVAMLVGDVQGAMGCLRASVKLESDLIDTSLKISSILCQGDEHDIAKYYLSQVERMSPNDVMFIMHKAEMLMKENDLQNATYYLKKALMRCLETDDIQRLGIGVHGPKSVSPLYKYRHCSSEAMGTSDNLYSSSARAVDEWVAHRKTDASWKLNCNLRCLLATALFKSNPENPVVALESLDTPADINCKSVQLYVTSGELRSQLGDVDMALNMFKKAHILDPYNPLPLLGATRAYLQMKQLKNAHEHVERAIELDPTFIPSYLDMSQVLVTYRQLNTAIGTLDKALTYAQPFIEIRDTLMAAELTLAQKESQEKLVGEEQ